MLQLNFMAPFSLSLQFCLKLKSLLVGNGLDDKLNSLTRWLKATFH